MLHFRLELAVDKAYIVVEAALPGIPSQDIDLTFDRGYLIIDGEKNEEEGGKAQILSKILSEFFLSS